MASMFDSRRVETLEDLVKHLEQNDPIGDEIIWAGQRLRSMIVDGRQDATEELELWPLESTGVYEE